MRTNKIVTLGEVLFHCSKLKCKKQLKSLTNKMKVCGTIGGTRLSQGKKYVIVSVNVVDGVGRNMWLLPVYERLRMCVRQLGLFLSQREKHH